MHKFDLKKSSMATSLAPARFLLPHATPNAIAGCAPVRRMIIPIYCKIAFCNLQNPDMRPTPTNY